MGSIKFIVVVIFCSGERRGKGWDTGNTVGQLSPTIGLKGRRKPLDQWSPSGGPRGPKVWRLLL